MKTTVNQFIMWTSISFSLVCSAMFVPRTKEEVGACRFALQRSAKRRALLAPVQGLKSGSQRNLPQQKQYLSAPRSSIMCREEDINSCSCWQNTTDCLCCLVVCPVVVGCCVSKACCYLCCSQDK